MLMVDGLIDQEREYLNIRQTEEMELPKCHIDAKRRAAECKALAHERFMKERSVEVTRAKKKKVSPLPLSSIAAETNAGSIAAIAFRFSPVPSLVVASMSPAPGGNFFPLASLQKSCMPNLHLC